MAALLKARPLAIATGGAGCVIGGRARKRMHGVDAQKIGGALLGSSGRSRCFACGYIFWAVPGTAELLALGERCCAGAQKFGGATAGVTEIGEKKRRRETRNGTETLMTENAGQGSARRSNCCAFAPMLVKIIKSRKKRIHAAGGAAATFAKLLADQRLRQGG
jgi:hypothetical protein